MTELTTADPRPPTAASPPAVGASWRPGAWSLPKVRWAAAATVLFAAGGISHLAGAPPWLWWSLYLACYAAGGWEPGLAGLRALRERTLDVDLLMVAAAIGAAAIGQVFDGALLIVIFATSGALEAVATKRTADSVRGLLDLTPERATRLTGAGDHVREDIVDVAVLQVGETILIRPGERVGADGRVLWGASPVDQASITGESLPVDKQAGDEVFAGTVNGTGVLRVRVTRAAGETVIARIVAMVEQASATKARTQLFIEKVEQRYSVVMVAATLALFTLPLAWGASVHDSLLRAMTFMIVASPCAVVLATMPPLLAAIATAGRHGVLVKSAVVMEHLADISQVAFDKTGTLTEGRPHLTGVHVLPIPGLSEARLLALAAAAEQGSEHPLGRAVVRAARDRGLTPAPAEEFGSEPGRGVTARVQGHLVEVASPAQLLHGDRGQDAAAAVVAGLQDGGHTAVVVRVDGALAGVLALADRMRPGAAETVAQLSSLTGARPVLLTGDNARAAERLAAQAGIGEVRADLLPVGKVTAVRELQAGGAQVALVGDGVNDAPALATAHVGIAMGRAGSDLALDTADAVITRDELAAVPAVIALARRARRLVTANLVVAAVFIAVLVAWDLFGDLRCHWAWPGTKAPPSSSASTGCACFATPSGAAPSPKAAQKADPRHDHNARRHRRPRPPPAHRLGSHPARMGRRRRARHGRAVRRPGRRPVDPAAGPLRPGGRPCLPRSGPPSARARRPAPARHHHRRPAAARRDSAVPHRRRRGGGAGLRRRRRAPPPAPGRPGRPADHRLGLRQPGRHPRDPAHPTGQRRQHGGRPVGGLRADHGTADQPRRRPRPAAHLAASPGGSARHRLTPTAAVGGGIDLAAAADAFCSTARLANPNTHRAYAGTIDRTVALLGANRPLADISDDEVATRSPGCGEHARRRH